MTQLIQVCESSISVRYLTLYRTCPLSDALAIAMLIICIAQGVDAGILIQQNLYAGNMAGKNKFSLPFVVVSDLKHAL